MKKLLFGFLMLAGVSVSHAISQEITREESFASKPVASTKPAKQVISEGTELANRFKKLAGLK